MGDSLFISGIRILCLLILLNPRGIHATDKLHTEAGISAYQYYYEEPGLMALQGLLFDGNTALAIQRPQDRQPIIRAEARYFLSDDPTYTSQNTGTSYRNYHTGFETRFLLGKTTYIGIGYRELMHHGEGTITSTGHIGYNRLSQYTYVPMGIRLALPNDHTMTLEYRHLNAAMQTTDFSFLGYKKIKKSQPNGYGLHANFKIKTTLDPDYFSTTRIAPHTLTTTFFLTYWHMDTSLPHREIVDTNNLPNWGRYFGLEAGGHPYQLTFTEPQNYTVEFGVALGLTF